MILNGKTILIGITGGIAAYKICELIRNLVKLGANVKTVVTPSAKEFVTETTLRTLTKNPVYCEQFNVAEWKPEHINLADEADIFVIAPASANTIGKIANGICDNLLTSMVMAFNKPVIIAPAMNCNMWNNKFVQNNIKQLDENNFNIIYPQEGELACGYSGIGRLADINKISNKVVELLTQKQFLKGKNIVITAGGTIEPIDPVRYIGNHSSGKMGIALADSASKFGANVTLISTVKTKKHYTVINVTTAEEMLQETRKAFNNSDILIMSAAVSDYKIQNPSKYKIKKENTDTITLNLVKNPDIVKEMVKIKQKNQIVIGFAAESDNLIENAKKKIESKNLDYIIANDISNKQIGFNSDYNAVSILNKEGNITELPLASKDKIADSILEKLFNK